MPLSKRELVMRACLRSKEIGDYWDRFGEMLDRKRDLSRGAFSQKEWNWYQGAKADLTEDWE